MVLPFPVINGGMMRKVVPVLSRSLGESGGNEARLIPVLR